LDDATGAVTASGVPAMVGLLLVGLFADGVVGNGWQMTGLGNYLGVEGQGVSGLFVANGYAISFPQQLQAQAIGVLALSLWGFVVGMVICIPLGLLFHALEGSEQARNEASTALAPPVMEPVYQEQAFELDFLAEEWNPADAKRRQARR
jgi:Amt family ammonium transporter